ncbi:aminodeoxychorismate/anthranilate synthase component II [Rhodocytophaga aerolata]|uniref:Aminodeoxychorismate/anthranilate synthase component II n=1 Tax=Rhodocytophaga aerolata TaxID=455078 RepID=A0ABT8RET1_9BACT|nr:aminodeoxychorismate/anthranilate synthase component II [Rhodocytophaga aerolata]MDO1450617.1 aminodeoxychorismate/anthranilate synthase component II [Rhodocytophaga aerolata]
MKILVLDNYDSFTYNLVHLLKELGDDLEIEVHRNDKISLEEVEKFDKILLSPGPGLPSDAGIMPALIKKYAPTKSILGICLGHQGISEIFGAKLENMQEVLHGVATPAIVQSAEEVLFKNIPASFNTCRYHSWTVVPESVPTAELEVTAVDSNGKVMAIRHKQFDVKGLQFHPESILTEHGKQMIKNWLDS